jgi:hypothetical protein
MAVPEIECMIEPGPKNRRWLTSILRGTQYHDRLRGLSLIARGPNQNGSGGNDPECEHRYDSDRQYSPNDLYCVFRFLFCLCSTVHP